MVRINSNRYVTPRTPDVFELHRPAWQRHALCHGRMPDFFPEYFTERKVAELRKVCEQCTVRFDCLEFALSFETDRDGFFGGHTPIERAGIRAARVIAAGKRGA